MMAETIIGNVVVQVLDRNEPVKMAPETFELNEVLDLGKQYEHNALGQSTNIGRFNEINDGSYLGRRSCLNIIYS